MKKTIFNLINLSHSTSIDKANDYEPACDCLTGLEAAGRSRTKVTGFRMTAICSHDRRSQVRPIREDMRVSLKETPRLFVCKKQFFNALPEFRCAYADVVKKSAAILRSSIQSGTEQLLDGLFFASHDSRPEE
jgi:hypothetical protein